MLILVGVAYESSASAGGLSYQFLLSLKSVKLEGHDALNFVPGHGSSKKEAGYASKDRQH